MGNKLLTIVVPVYKVEPYINKCLDSCLIYKTKEQGEKMLDEDLMNQLEVVIVNDGTPDRSAEMSREYVKRFPNTFRQIDKENGGHGSAWNVGLKEATGKYLRFLDSDDWLTNLSLFLGKLAETDADIVLTNYREYHVQTGKYHEKLTSFPYDCEKSLSLSLLHGLKQGYIEINFWHGTYKTSILKPLWPLFAERVMYDDSVLSFAPLAYGRTIVSLDLLLYNYLIGREGQSMDSKVQSKNARSYVVCQRHEEDVRKRLESISIPEDLNYCIDEVLSEYAHFAFPFFVYLPYSEAKERMNGLANRYPWKEKDKMSKIWKRFYKYPFVLFYVVEKGRALCKSFMH